MNVIGVLGMTRKYKVGEYFRGSYKRLNTRNDDLIVYGRITRIEYRKNYAVRTSSNVHYIYEPIKLINNIYNHKGFHSFWHGSIFWKDTRLLKKSV